MAEEKMWKLKLYVAGERPTCLNASANLRRLCNERLRGKCEVEVIDIIKHPEAASDEQIVAVPTLIKQSPLPIRRLVGDLSNTERLLIGLNLQEA